MTAKRKGGGLLARLEVLEAKEEERREEVRAQAWAVLEKARNMLAPADRAALDDAQILTEEDPTPEHAALIARIEEECRALGLFGGPPVSHTAKEEADAWEPIPDGEDVRPLTPPPASRVADFCAYFELCALWCDSEAKRADYTEDIKRLLRWGRALWRFEANICRILGGHDGAGLPFSPSHAGPYAMTEKRNR